MNLGGTESSQVLPLFRRKKLQTANCETSSNLYPFSSPPRSPLCTQQARLAPIVSLITTSLLTSITGSGILSLDMDTA